MSYYPILAAAGCEGWTTLCNFAPNNWESKRIRRKRINLTWREEPYWKTEILGELEPEEMRTIRRAEVAALVPASELALLSLSTAPLGSSAVSLPEGDLDRTIVPAWRATLGLSSSSASTSYQGEIDAFPPTGSLLTFGSMTQFRAGVRNYLLFVNLEKSPSTRASTVEIYDAATAELMATFSVRNNAISSIPLDDIGFDAGALPVIICRTMAALPLYFSSTEHGSFLSLEHTHPPASYVIHGRRWEAQKLLKERWFAKASA